jgi:hypothetical protein
MPAWGTLLYRQKTLSDERWHQLLSWLAEQGIAQQTPNAPFPMPVVWVDGTKVGFTTPFDAPYRRGAEIRQRRSRVKAVVLVFCRGGRCWVVGASVGWVYADEGRLLLEWLSGNGNGGWVWVRCWWGTDDRGIVVGCWRAWSRWVGSLWCRWRQVCASV